jgi:hypothetical protein
MFARMFPLPAGELFFEGSLPEKRLRERALTLLTAMTERPGVAMTAAFDDPRESRNAYNFFHNDRMTLEVLLDPATRALSLKLRELPEGTTVLSVQDTTEINLSTQTAMEGLGTLGNVKNHGLMLHTALAVDTDGGPMGLLHAHPWARPPKERGKATTRRHRAFDEKESARWWATIAACEQNVRRPGLLLHVGDRESDIFPLFSRAHAASFRLLVRAGQDRCVEGEHDALWAHVDTFADSTSRRTLEVAARPASKTKPARLARQAVVAIGFGAVVLRAPHRSQGALPLWAVRVREVAPPAGEERIAWVLLTSDPIRTVDDAWLRADWYGARWVIEEYFKVLKTGCRIEARQFESRPPFEISLGLSMLAAVELLALTKRARIAPDDPASSVLSADAAHVLRQHAASHHRSYPDPMRLQEAVVEIAILGGYQNRSCDGPPGWITLWRGYQRLVALLEGYLLARATLLGEAGRH